MKDQLRYLMEQMDDWQGELVTQSDRGVALITAAVVDELLRHLILKRMIEISESLQASLFDRPQAPLSSFSAKIEIAFALGVIPEEAVAEFHLVRNVRNRFAHRFEALTFDHPEIARLVRAAHKDTTLTIRQEFLASFDALAVMIMGILLVDTRIKSLRETHGAWTKSPSPQEIKQFAEAIERRWRDKPLPAWVHARARR